MVREMNSPGMQESNMDNELEVFSGSKKEPGSQTLPSRGGRPRAEIDLAELEKLSALQCTDEEIAAWFGVTERTIENRRKEPAFAEVMARGKARGRISVRRQQMKLLEEGNATMGVWLGKQLLGQMDQVAVQNNVQVAVLLPNGGSLDDVVEIERTR